MIANRNAEALKLTAPGRGGEHKEDALSREWVNVLVRPKALSKRREKDKDKDRESGKYPHLGKGDHSNPIDRKDDDEKADAKKSRVVGVSAGSSSGRAAASGSALDPSVIFSTITNTSEGMTCLHINAAITQAVAGFKDSCLRVWRLDERADSMGKFGCLLDGQWSMEEKLPSHAGPKEFEMGKSGQGPSPSPSLFSLPNRVGFVGGDQDNKRSKSKARDVLELYGHSKTIYGVSQSADEDSRLLLSCSADETIRLWDTSVSQCVGKYSCIGPSWGVSFSPLGYYFASANQV